MYARDTTNRVFIRNIPFQTTESQLRKEFSKFGSFLDFLYIQKRGIAFITFEDKKAYQSCRNADGNIYLEGRQINVRKAAPKGSSTDYDYDYDYEYEYVEAEPQPKIQPSNQKSKVQDTIFISNIPADIEDFEIRDLFLKYRPYELKTNVTEDERAQFAFIRIVDTSSDLVNKAVKEMNGYLFKGKKISVTYSNTPFKYSNL